MDTAAQHFFFSFSRGFLLKKPEGCRQQNITLAANQCNILFVRNLPAFVYIQDHAIVDRSSLTSAPISAHPLVTSDAGSSDRRTDDLGMYPCLGNIIPYVPIQFNTFRHNRLLFTLCLQPAVYFRVTVFQQLHVDFPKKQ